MKYVFFWFWFSFCNIVVFASNISVDVFVRLFWRQWSDYRQYVWFVCIGGCDSSMRRSNRSVSERHESKAVRRDHLGHSLIKQLYRFLRPKDIQTYLRSADNSLRSDELSSFAHFAQRLVIKWGFRLLRAATGRGSHFVKLDAYKISRGRVVACIKMGHFEDGIRDTEGDEPAAYPTGIGPHQLTKSGEEPTSIELFE